MLALLSRVEDGSRGRREPGTLKEELEAVDVDGRAAAHATLQPEREGVGVGARAGENRESIVPSRRSLPMSAAYGQAAPWFAAAPGRPPG